MRLAAFINNNIEEISLEWEKFAATLLPNQTFSVSILRDGIKPILREIAADMQSAQTLSEQQEKSEGANEPKLAITPAKNHALARISMGLSSLQMISEFRALRATVVRLWQKEDVLDKQDVYDLTRFHEAIDQTLSEAATAFAQKTEESRNVFLGILGHDLRSPLGAISGAAQLIAMGKNPDRFTPLANIIIMSAGRMSYMITDLLELTRAHSGQGLIINSHSIEIRKVCIDVLAEIQAFYPEKNFKLIAHNEIYGYGDEMKLKQVLSNLVGNAIQHGSKDSPITITATKLQDGVELRVHNQGKPIPAELQNNLFNCFVQGVAGHREHEDISSSVGLGLYIAKEIIEAHSGTISVVSNEKSGTNFIVQLPDQDNQVA